MLIESFSTELIQLEALLRTPNREIRTITVLQVKKSAKSQTQQKLNWIIAAKFDICPSS